VAVYLEIVIHQLAPQETLHQHLLHKVILVEEVHPQDSAGPAAVVVVVVVVQSV
jgi:hypothetical protein